MNKNKTQLDSFVEYCTEHPEMRFWQALRNWSGRHFILASYYAPHDDLFNTGSSIEDTYYWAD